MKSRGVLRALHVAATLAAAVHAHAQVFDLSWNTVDGGGITFATGGAFALGGTIGQADAGGPFTGGAFRLTGGFWVDTASALPCIGDLDGNNAVGLQDLTIVLAAFGSCVGDADFNAAADFDGSGCIGISDLTFFLAQFGTTC